MSTNAVAQVASGMRQHKPDKVQTKLGHQPRTQICDHRQCNSEFTWKVTQQKQAFLMEIRVLLWSLIRPSSVLF